MSDPTDEIIQNMLEQAVYQQLFVGGNRIQGKNPEYSMQITGSGEILSKFMDRLRKTIPLLIQHDSKTFLQTFENEFHLSLAEVKERVETNFAGMGDLSGQEIIIVYMVLTKFLEHIREYAYNHWARTRIEKDYQELSGKPFNSRAQDRLQMLAAMNDPNITLLYNLAFIAMLAEVYGDKKLITTTRRLVTVKINLIVKKIIDQVIKQETG